MLHPLPEVETDQRKQREVAYDYDVVSCVQTRLHVRREGGPPAVALRSSEREFLKTCSGERLRPGLPPAGSGNLHSDLLLHRRLYNLFRLSGIEGTSNSIQNRRYLPAVESRDLWFIVIDYGIKKI